MAQRSVASPAPESAEGAVVTEDAAARLFGGAVNHVGSARQVPAMTIPEAVREEVQEIILMHFPHADELVALIILLIAGRQRYPGIEKAAVRVRTAYDNFRILQELADQGKAILLGDGGRMGNGIFDEHAGGRTRKDCVTLGVARDLGLDRSPRQWLLWKSIVGDITQIDTQGSFLENRRWVTLGSNIWEAHLRQGRQINWVIERVMEDVEALLKDEEALLETTSPHTKGKVKFGGRDFEVWYLRGLDPNKRSDQEEVRAARLLGADLVVVQAITGHIQILRGRYFPEQAMARIAALVLSKELAKSGDDLKTMDPRTLFEPSGEGLNATSSPAENWYFDPRTHHLLNGGESHRETTNPTALTIDEVEERIEQALNDAEMTKRIEATFGARLSDANLRNWLRERTGLPK